MNRFGLQRGMRHKLRVGLVITGHDRERDVFFPGDRGNLLYPIGPIADTANQADNHQARFGDDSLDIKINGQVVAELHQIGEPDPWRLAVARDQAGLGGGKAGELGIRRR